MKQRIIVKDAADRIGGMTVGTVQVEIEANSSNEAQRALGAALTELVAKRQAAVIDEPCPTHAGSTHGIGGAERCVNCLVARVSMMELEAAEGRTCLAADAKTIAALTDECNQMNDSAARHARRAADAEAKLASAVTERDNGNRDRLCAERKRGAAIVERDQCRSEASRAEKLLDVERAAHAETKRIAHSEGARLMEELRVAKANHAERKETANRLAIERESVTIPGLKALIPSYEAARYENHDVPGLLAAVKASQEKRERMHESHIKALISAIDGSGTVDVTGRRIDKAVSMAVKHRIGWLADISVEHRALTEELRDARHKLNVVFHAADDVWFWQDTGNNEPVSLSCPVVMEAETMRGFVRDRETMKAWGEELHKTRTERDDLRAHPPMVLSPISVADVRSHPEYIAMASTLSSTVERCSRQEEELRAAKRLDPDVARALSAERLALCEALFRDANESQAARQREASECLYQWIVRRRDELALPAGAP